jgi:hypothetical protein
MDLKKENRNNEERETLIQDLTFRGWVLVGIAIWIWELWKRA